MRSFKRGWVTFTYTCELLALSVWIGGLVVIVAAVIPAVFNSLGMEPGGRFLTRVFDGYNRLMLVSSAVLLVAMLARFAVGHADMALRPSTGEWLLTVGMVVIAALLVVVLTPDAVSRQEQAFLTKDEAARRAAYEAFFKSHHLVRALYVVTVVLGVALMSVKVTGWAKGERGTT